MLPDLIPPGTPQKKTGAKMEKHSRSSSDILFRTCGNACFASCHLCITYFFCWIHVWYFLYNHGGGFQNHGPWWHPVVLTCMSNFCKHTWFGCSSPGFLQKRFEKKCKSHSATVIPADPEILVVQYIQLHIDIITYIYICECIHLMIYV